MRRELPLVGVALTVLCALVFGAHLQPGGFYNDDWNYLVPAHFSGGYFDAVAALGDVFGPNFRPALRLYLAATYGVFGVEPTGHVAWLLAVGTAMTVMLYAILRRTGVAPGHAGAISAIVLVLADADSARFWPCIGANVLSLILYAAGVLVSLRALRRDGARAWAAHALAVGLIVASLTLYNITVGMALTGGVLYVLYAGRRGALRWMADIVAAVAVTVLITGRDGYPSPPLQEYPQRIIEVGKDAAWVLADSLWAPSHPSGLVVAGIWLGLVGVLVTGWRRAGHARLDRPVAHAVRRWLLVAVGAAFVAAATYVPIVPLGYLSPRAPGQLNRVNIAGGAALVVLTYATLMVAALLLVARDAQTMRRAGALVGAAAAIIAAGNIAQSRRDQRDWERAAVMQRFVVGSVAAAVGRVPSESLVITYAMQFYSAPEVPVFAYPWDLSGALAVHYDDKTIRGYPALGRVKVTCDATSLTIERQGEPFAPVTASYGRSWVVDVAATRATALVDRRTCRRASAALTV
jgi:hypothetical protein